MRVRIENIGASMPLKDAENKMGSVEHAVAAGKDCFAGSNHTPDSVNVLINAGLFRDKHIAEPAMAAFIQNELQMNPEFHGNPTFSFDLINGGVGMLNAFHLLAEMLKAGTIRVGMAVSSEFNPDKIPDPNFNYIPSGAAALLEPSPDPEQGFGSFHFKTFEEYAELYTTHIDLKEIDTKLIIKQKEGLHTAYLSAASQFIDELLAKEDLTLDQVDLIIPSQISSQFIGNMAETLNLLAEKVLDISQELTGDTFTTSTILGLNYAIKNKRIVPGQKVMLLALAAGITVGGVIYTL